MPVITQCQGKYCDYVVGGKIIMANASKSNLGTLNLESQNLAALKRLFSRGFSKTSGGLIRYLAPAVFAVSASCGQELLVRMPSWCGSAHDQAARSHPANPSAFQMGQPMPVLLG